MAKRLFVEGQNGNVRRVRHRFSGHGGKPDNRHSRAEVREERQLGRQFRAELLASEAQAMMTGGVGLDECLCPRPESSGGPHQFDAEAWAFILASFDGDELSLSVKFDETSGLAMVASCGRRRSFRRR